MTHLHPIFETDFREVCTYPVLGSLLGDYFVELLEDSAAEEVEDHLLDCLHCRNKYLKMLGLMDTGRSGRALDVSETGEALKDANTSRHRNLLRMIDFTPRRT